MARKNKAECQRIHAARRLQQRYDFRGFSEDLVDDIIDMIQHGDSVFVLAESIRLRHHIVIVEGFPVPVVYDTHREEIATVLPYEALPGYGVHKDQVKRLKSLGMVVPWPC